MGLWCETNDGHNLITIMRYANISSLCSNVILWANFALQTHNKRRDSKRNCIIYYCEVSKRGENRSKYYAFKLWMLSRFFPWETYDTICWSGYFSIDLFLPPSGSFTDVRWPKFVGFSTPELRISLRTSLFGQISGIGLVVATDTWQKQEHLTQNPWLCENVDAGKKEPSSRMLVRLF